MQVDLNKYTDFVNSVTSKPTNDVEALIARLQELSREPNLNISLLMNSGTGLASEGGEFNEIVKKIVYQGKPFDEAARFHMKRELGDLIFYWTNACRALNLDPNDVIQENCNKLSKRYPDGFSIERSENRDKNDI